MIKRDIDENTINMLEWGEILNGTSIPTIEIIDPKLEGDNQVVGYLHPFRGYKFQVSGTAEGSMDLGSTRVIGLGHLINLTHKSGPTYRSNRNMEGISKELILAMISLAVCNFCHSSYGYGYVPPEMLLSRINVYVDSCYNWICIHSCDGDVE